MSSFLIAVSLLVVSTTAFADNAILRFSYWTEASPPFVILDGTPEKPVKSGVLKDIAEEIADQLNMQAVFINLPVQRIEQQLSTGEIDIDCITQPAWKKQADDFHWSPVIFQGADRFLVNSSQKHELKAFEDLKGKTLGVYNGYIYAPSISEMIQNGTVQVVKVAGIDHGVKLLSLNRIDALIDFDVLLEYKIASGYQDSFALADLIAERYDLFCAYSKKMKVEASQVDSVIETMVKTGKIKSILKQYHLFSEKNNTF